MSKTVDERIVSMQFDNKNFESNVQTSMSTLDKLKQKLHLPGASKGLEEVSKSAKKVDLNPISRSAEAVQVKFTAMQTIADQALRNITNSAMAAGKRILSALTIDPVKDGFQEYEMMLNAIQTTMSATGKTAKEVEDELKKLDDYADKTVYSSADMLNNLPKFTNAGVELETATKAMIGIANATAHAGGDASKASIAFYNLGQAIGTGYLSRMDYNSINNAGIATMAWKEQMVEAAIAAGTLKKKGEDAYVAGGKTFTLQQLFIDGLQKQWATTDVMLKVFGDYGNETTEIGKAAYEAATKIKTFTMMMDSLKATAGTGWKDTWQIIFGDLDAATELWTGIGNFISKIIDKMAKWRNRILDTALAKTFRSLADSLSTVLTPVSMVTGALLDYDKLVDEIIAGKWKNAPTRWQDLAAAGYDWAYAQNLVNERLGCSVRHATNYTEGQQKMAAATNSLTEAQALQLIELAKLSDEELRAKGWTDEQIKALRQLQKEARRLGVSFEFFIKNIDKINGRWALIEGFKNLGKAFGKVFGAIGDAWKETFSPITGKGLYNVIATFHRITKALIISDETADNLKRTFKGLFAVLYLVKMVIGGGFRILWAVIKGVAEVLGYVDLNILGLTARIGDFLVKIKDWIKEHDILTRVIVRVIAAIFKVGKVLVELLKKLWRLPKVQKVVESITNAFRKMKNAIKGAAKSTAGFLDRIESVSFEDFKNGLKKVLTFMKNAFSRINDHFGGVPGDIIAGLGNGLAKGAKKVWDTISNLAKGVIDFFCKILGIHSPSTVFFAIGGFIIAGLLGGLLGGESSLAGAATGLVDKVTGIFGSIPWGTIFAGGAGIGMIMTASKIVGVLNNVTAPLAGVGSVLEGTGEVLAKSSGAIAKTIRNFAKIEKATAKAIKAKAWQMRADAIKTFAIAIVMLVAAVVVLTFIDPGKLWASIAALGVIAGILAGVSVAINKFGGSLNLKNALGASASILVFTVALMGIVLAIALLSLIPQAALEKSLMALTVIVLGISVLIATMGIALKGAGTTTVLAYAALIAAIGAAFQAMMLVVTILGLIPVNVLLQGVIASLALAALIAALIWATSLAGSPKKVQYIGKTIKGIGTALLLMAITVAILGNLDKSTIDKGIAAILALGILIIGLIWATSLGGSANKVKNIGKTIKGIAVALLLMALTVAILGNLKASTLIKGIAAVTALGVLIAGLMYATKLAGGRKKGLFTTLLGISFAMLIIAGIALILGIIPSDKLWKGVAAVAVLSALMMGLIAVTKLAKNVKGTLVGLALCIALLVAAVVILAYIDTGRMIASVAALSVLMGMLMGVLIAAKGIRGSWKSAAMLAVVGALLVGLAIVLIPLSKLPLQNVLASALALSLVMLALSAVLIVLGKQSRTMRKAKEGALAMVALSVPIIAIALALKSLGNTNNSLESVVSLSAMMAAMTGVLVLLGKNRKYTKKAKEGIVGLAALSVPLALFALTLNLLPVGMESVETTLALTALMSAMTGVLVLLGKNQRYVKKAMPGVIGLAALVIPLAAFALVLKLIPLSPESLITVTAMSAIMYAMTGVLILLSKSGKFMKNATTAVLQLALLVVPMAAFALVLWGMSYIADTTENAIALSALMIAMSAVLGVLAVCGLAGPAAIVGIAALAALIVPMGLFLLAILAIGAIDSAEKNIDLIIKLMSSMTTLLVKLALVAPLAVIGVAALTVLATVITVMTVVVTAIGGLFEMCPSLEKFVAKGIKIMIKLAEGLGEMISAFLSGLLSRLPEIGLMLSRFIINATPFFVGIKMIDTDVIKEVGNIVAAILLLSAASFIDSILTIMSFGSSFADLGTKLSKFTKNASGFFEAAKEINPAVMAGVENLADAILILTAANLIDGIAGWLTGSSGVEKFGKELPKLGKGLSGFMTNLGIMGDAQVTTVECACKSIKLLAEAADTIPNTGGFWQSIVGENGLGKFAKNLGPLGAGMNKFITNLGSFGEDRSALVEAACDGIKNLAKAAKTIGPNVPWGYITSLGDFSEKLGPLGEGMNKFINNINLTDTDNNVIQGKIDAAKAAGEIIKNLASAAKTLQDYGGVSIFDAIVAAAGGDGEAKNGFQHFVEYLPTLGEKLGEFVSKMGAFDPTQLTSLASIKTFITNITGLLKTGGDSGDPMVLYNRLSGFSEGLDEFSLALAAFVEKVSTDLKPEDIDAALAGIKSLVDFVTSISDDTITKITSLKEAMNGLAKDAVDGFISAFDADQDVIEALTDAIDALIAVATSYVDGLAGKTGLKGAGPTGIKKSFQDLAIACVTMFVSDEAKKSCEKNANSMVNTLKDNINSTDNMSKIKTAGTNLTLGLKDGLLDVTAQNRLGSAAASLVGVVKRAVEKASDQHSPSKLFRKVGQYIPMGFALGLTDMNGKVEASATTMVDAAIDTVKHSIASVASGVFDNIDSQPTIRPVLDMSDVVSGASALNGLFSNPSVGLTGSISASMNKRQNRGSDVVSAIESLRKDLGNVGGTSYTINGVNYSGESDVADAIKVITRAATMNRRI